MGTTRDYEHLMSSWAITSRSMVSSALDSNVIFPDDPLELPFVCHKEDVPSSDGENEMYLGQRSGLCHSNRRSIDFDDRGVQVRHLSRVVHRFIEIALHEWMMIQEMWG
jgi:hypothetical protein